MSGRNCSATTCSPYVPLAARIKMVLDERPTHSARASRFLEELEDFMSDTYADRTLKSVVNWGRYGELLRLRRGFGDAQPRKSGLTQRDSAAVMPQRSPVDPEAMTKRLTT